MRAFRPPFSPPLLAVCCLLLALRSAVAGIVIQYPPDTPLLSFTLPDGWQHLQQTNEVKAFSAQPPNDEGTILNLVVVESIKDDSMITKMLPTLVRASAKGFGVTDLQADQPNRVTLSSGIDAIRCAATGKAKGQDCTVMVYWFKIDGHPVVVTEVSSDNAERTGLLDSVLSSFKPLR